MPAPIDLADLAAYLEALAAHLQTDAATHQSANNQLGQRQADIAAFRRVLGISSSKT